MISVFFVLLLIIIHAKETRRCFYLFPVVKVTIMQHNRFKVLFILFI